MVNNTLWLKQNGRHYANDCFKLVFLIGNRDFTSKILPKCSIHNEWAMFPKMFQRHHLSQWWPSLPMSICVIRPLFNFAFIIRYGSLGSVVWTATDTHPTGVQKPILVWFGVSWPPLNHEYPPHSLPHCQQCRVILHCVAKETDSIKDGKEWNIFIKLIEDLVTRASVYTV